MEHLLEVGDEHTLGFDHTTAQRRRHIQQHQELGLELRQSLPRSPVVAHKQVAVRTEIFHSWLYFCWGAAPRLDVSRSRARKHPIDGAGCSAWARRAALTSARGALLLACGLTLGMGADFNQRRCSSTATTRVSA